jgi:hypothetical protein
VEWLDSTESAAFTFILIIFQKPAKGVEWLKYSHLSSEKCRQSQKSWKYSSVVFTSEIMNDIVKRMVLKAQIPVSKSGIVNRRRNRDESTDVITFHATTKWVSGMFTIVQPWQKKALNCILQQARSTWTVWSMGEAWVVRNARKWLLRRYWRYETLSPNKKPWMLGKSSRAPYDRGDRWSQNNIFVEREALFHKKRKRTETEFISSCWLSNVKNGRVPCVVAIPYRGLIEQGPIESPRLD